MEITELNIDEIRQLTRTRIEGLELWLRRLITETLTPVYGTSFLVAKRTDDTNIIANSTRTEIENRFNRNPERYSRIIDAAHIDECVKIICNPLLFDEHFSSFFDTMLPTTLPNRNQYLRHLLSSIISARHNLSHANGISTRLAEQVLCYSNDVIDSIKKQYSKMGSHEEYNVPIIIKISDSFGNVHHRRNPSVIENVDYSNNTNCVLRPGDVIRIEVEVDPSYTSSRYQFRFGGGGQDYSYNNVLVHTITEHDVSPKKVIHCQVKSDKAWNRFSGRDDQVSLHYKVLPPIEEN
jgi:hypothetical protein